MLLNSTYGPAFEYVLYFYGVFINLWMLSGLFASPYGRRKTRILSVSCWLFSSIVHIVYREYLAELIPVFPLRLIVETALTVGDGILFTSWRKGWILNKFSVALFAIAVQYQLNALVNLIIAGAFPSAGRGTPLFVIMNRLLGTLSLLLIRKMAMRQEKHVPVWHYISLILLSLVTLYTSFFITIPDDWHKLVMCGFLLSLDFSTLSVTRHMVSMHLDLTERLMIDQKNQLTHQQVEDSLQHLEEARMIRHEYNNNLLALQILAAQGKETELKDALGRMLQIGNASEDVRISSGNRTIDMILSDKLKTVRTRNIPVHVQAMIPDDLPVDVLDVCTVLFNLLDNALEAGQKVTEPRVDITLHTVGGYLTILVRNRIEQSILAVNPELITSKDDSGQHGYGVKAVRKIVEKYQGLLDFYEEDGWFCACAMLRYE